MNQTPWVIRTVAVKATTSEPVPKADWRKGTVRRYSMVEPGEYSIVEKPGLVHRSGWFGIVKGENTLTHIPTGRGLNIGHRLNHEQCKRYGEWLAELEPNEAFWNRNMESWDDEKIGRRKRPFRKTLTDYLYWLTTDDPCCEPAACEFCQGTGAAGEWSTNVFGEWVWQCVGVPCSLCNGLGVTPAHNEGL
jgi:hypothetical protein